MTDLLDMQEFFAERAATWEHFVKEQWLPDVYDHYYTLLASPIPVTDEPIKILDIGCGGGIEFEWILPRAPNARVTGIDQSTAMLSCLRQKYAARLEQFDLIEESYLTYPFPTELYDFAITSMSIHYFRPEIRGHLYGRIREALKPGALYIEGTYCADDLEDEQKRLDHFDQITKDAPGADAGRYKCNLPLARDTVTRLKVEAGFRDVTWLRDEDMVVTARR